MDEHKLAELFNSPGMTLLDGESAIVDESIDESEPSTPPHELFRWDDYDWSAPGFYPQYRVIRLGDPTSPHKRRRSEWSGVFFSVVSHRRFLLCGIGDVSWYPLVEYVRDEHGEKTDTIKRVTAHRNVWRGKESNVLYLHREITNAKKGDVIDHRGEGPLDNRDEALQKGTYSRNNLTARPRQITRRYKLLPGVEWTDNRHKRVQGILKVNRVRIRSPETYTLADQARAHAWYKAERERHIRELALDDSWQNWDGPVPPLILPPRLKRFYTARLPAELAEVEIPF
jgi:hypothetical protein